VLAVNLLAATQTILSATNKSTNSMELAVNQLVKELYSCYGTRKFITTFTRAHHLSL